MWNHEALESLNKMTKLLVEWASDAESRQLLFTKDVHGETFENYIFLDRQVEGISSLILIPK